MTVPSEIKFVCIRNLCSLQKPESSVIYYFPGMSCTHEVRIIYADGSIVEQTLEGLDIWNLIADLPNDKILTKKPGALIDNTFYKTKPEHPEQYKLHFQVYAVQNKKPSLLSRMFNCFKKNQ